MKKSEALNILDLHDGFTEDELKKAHRKKVVENHPDRFQDPAEKAKAEERTKLINEANDILKSGKWDPEYGPRAHSSAYGTGPYRNPYSTQGAEWVEVEIDPEMFRRWAEQAAQQQQQQGYDPFNPFVSTYAAPTAEQRAARAQQDMRVWLMMLAVKLLLCGIQVVNGNYYDAMLIWATITYLLLIAGRFGGCGWIVMLLLIPMFFSTSSMLEALALEGGVLAAALIVALFASSLFFDFRDLRETITRYRETHKKES